ncbi:MAG TPA: VWA domain-containing protein [Acidobacterium sp.]|nr:VWA domain-containing protein [Acidobacterium sp.]
MGQIIDSPDAPPVSTAPPTPATANEKPVTTLKVNVDLVNFYFTARGKHGQLIDDLTREDCSLYENKQPQKIKSWTANANQPLTLGILLDTSGSQQDVLPLEKQSASKFLRDVLRPKDQAFVLTFDVDVNLAQDFTNDIPLLDHALQQAQINTAGGGGSGGIPGLGQGPVPTVGDPKGTVLYDAVAQAANDKLREQTGRKALILLTDGEDLGSATKPLQAIADAQKANTIVYVILIADRGFYGGYTFGYTGDAQMRRLAEATGGRMINVGNNGAKLTAAFKEIARELRTQYAVSYTPANRTMDGKFRKVEIACRLLGVKIDARQGYYALPTMGN